MTPRWVTPRGAAWLYAALIAALLSYFMLGIPVQLTDSYQNLLGVQQLSLRELMVSRAFTQGYLRPLLFAPIKILDELADGRYFAWFRGFHAAQLCVTMALFVVLLRVRSWMDAAVVPLAVAALVGLHTFAGTIREAFPVNTFLTVVDCCLLAALIASVRPRWWSTSAAVLLLAFAAFTVESGLLVWVIFVAGFIAGWRGVSRTGLVLTTLVVLGYFGARFLLFDVGTPSMLERSTGFGTEILEPSQVAARFGANPWPLYAYNIAASVGSVLFGEPRGGVFTTLRGFREDDLQPWSIVSFIACTVLTIAIVRYVVSRRETFVRWQLEYGDQLVVVFGAVLLANAALNFVYTKDVVMSPAGAFFALAGFVGVRTWASETSTMSRRQTRALACVCLLVLSTAWSIRLLGVHYRLRSMAWHVRSEWAYADAWLEEQGASPTTLRSRALKNALQADALWLRPAPPRVVLRWPSDDWFDTLQ